MEESSQLSILKDIQNALEDTSLIITSAEDPSFSRTLTQTKSPPQQTNLKQQNETESQMPLFSNSELKEFDEFSKVLNDETKEGNKLDFSFDMDGHQIVPVIPKNTDIRDISPDRLKKTRSSSIVLDKALNEQPIEKSSSKSNLAGETEKIMKYLSQPSLTLQNSSSQIKLSNPTSARSSLSQLNKPEIKEEKFEGQEKSFHPIEISILEQKNEKIKDALDDEFERLFNKKILIPNDLQPNLKEKVEETFLDFKKERKEFEDLTVENHDSELERLKFDRELKRKMSEKEEKDSLEFDRLFQKKLDSIEPKTELNSIKVKTEQESFEKRLIETQNELKQFQEGFKEKGIQPAATIDLDEFNMEMKNRVSAKPQAELISPPPIQVGVGLGDFTIRDFRDLKIDATKEYNQQEEKCEFEKSFQKSTLISPSPEHKRLPSGGPISIPPVYTEKSAVEPNQGFMIASLKQRIHELEKENEELKLQLKEEQVKKFTPSLDEVKQEHQLNALKSKISVLERRLEYSQFTLEQSEKEKEDLNKLYRDLQNEVEKMKNWKEPYLPSSKKMVSQIVGTDDAPLCLRKSTNDKNIHTETEYDDLDKRFRDTVGTPVFKDIKDRYRKSPEMPFYYPSRSERRKTDAEIYASSPSKPEPSPYDFRYEIPDECFSKNVKREHFTSSSHKQRQFSESTRERSKGHYQTSPSVNVYRQPYSNGKPQFDDGLKKVLKEKLKQQFSQQQQQQRDKSPFRKSQRLNMNVYDKPLPFVVGKSIEPSHSLSANLQRIRSLLKQHDPDHCDVCQSQTRSRSRSSHRNPSPTPSLTNRKNEILLSLEDELQDLKEKYEKQLRKAKSENRLHDEKVRRNLKESLKYIDEKQREMKEMEQYLQHHSDHLSSPVKNWSALKSAQKFQNALQWIEQVEHSLAFGGLKKRL